MSDVREGSLVRPDGRTVAWSECGLLDGRPVLRLPGTPGSRLSVRADQAPWVERGLRIITVERPGFGVSTRLPGRGFVEHADDLAAILDHLGIGSVPVYGGSGGAPHVLAFAARHPDRVRACAIGDGAAPLTDDELGQQVDLNVAGDGLARTGRAEELRLLLDEARTSILADPVAGFGAIMDTAPAADQEIMADPDLAGRVRPRDPRGTRSRRRRLARRGPCDQRRLARRRCRSGHEHGHLVAQ